MKSKNVNFIIPECLLDKIQKRAIITGKQSRNAEIRYLLTLALEWTGEVDPLVELDEGPRCRPVVWLEDNMTSIVKERARSHQRSMGAELVRLLTYALQESARRDVAMISEMLEKMGRSQPIPLQTELI